MEQSYANVPAPEPRIYAASVPEHSVSNLSTHHLDDNTIRSLSH